MADNKRSGLYIDAEASDGILSEKSEVSDGASHEPRPRDSGPRDGRPRDASVSENLGDGGQSRDVSVYGNLGGGGQSRDASVYGNLGDGGQSRDASVYGNLGDGGQSRDASVYGNLGDGGQSRDASVYGNLGDGGQSRDASVYGNHGDGWQSRDAPMAEDRGGDLLHQAVQFNNAELLESLLQGDEKQFINSLDPNDKTALYTAVAKQYVECCHLLLEAGADANAQCGPLAGWQTPLHSAARDNKAQLVALLLEHGAQWFLPDSAGKTALTLAESAGSVDASHIIQTYAHDLEAQLYLACTKADVATVERLIPKVPEHTVAKVLNRRSGDSHHSFLHSACESGDTAFTRLLLAHNQDDTGVHPVTGHSPLHAACSHGNIECVKLLLQKFPELIQAPTIDGILPLHEACFEGHVTILQLLFTFAFPEAIIKTFKEQNGRRMYRLGFNINAKDGHGRTPLHIACMRNKSRVVRELLQFKTKVTSKYMEGTFKVSRDRRKQGYSITSKRLSRSEGGLGMFGEELFHVAHEDATEAEELNAEECIHPVACDIDSIDLDGNTPLHVAVKGDAKQGYHEIAEMLLKHRANPNKPIISPSGNVSSLMLACTREDAQVVSVLLKYGARDADNKVLGQAISVQNEDIIGVFLRSKNRVDAGVRVNAPKLYEIFRMSRPGSMSVSWCNATVNLRHIWPNTPVALDWRGLGLLSLSLQWLVEACKLHNKRKSALSNVTVPIEQLAVFAITRMDVSDNELTQLPLEVFRLPSLRILNAANNQIDWIPGCVITVPRSCSCLGNILRSHGNDRHSKGVTPPCSPTCVHKTAYQESVQTSDELWDCPLLEEINFQSNKLLSVPKALCRLPLLRKLNLSFNKLTSLPLVIWQSHSLAELNVSHNALQKLSHADAGSKPEVTSQGGEGGPKEMTSQTEETFESSSAQDLHSAAPVEPQSSHHGNELVNLKLPGYQAGFMQIHVSHIEYWHETLKIHDSNDSTKSSRTSAHSKLTDLNLSHNSLSVVPDTLACVTPQLETLNLSHNKISRMGLPGLYPAGLRELDLSHNEIAEMLTEDIETSVDSGVYSLPPVCMNLHAKSNRAAQKGTGNQCRHRGHSVLDRLKTLKLSHNRLSRVRLLLDSAPRDVTLKARTARPKAGSTSSTGSTEATTGLLFPSLSILDVAYNELSTLSRDAALHIHLSELKLQYNCGLTELPAELGLLRKLWNLDISGCRVREHLQALLGDKARRTAEVLGYLKSIKEEATPYNRMKLMFVGIQGIGKTSLLNALRNHGKTSTKSPKNWAQRMGHSSIQGRDHKGENISTVGVDISDLTLEKDGARVVFSTWDFGGQREYYATHQYFLSRRSLYLVVWNVQSGEKGVNEIMQWLVNIQARAPNSPVIIVGTHLDMIDQSYPANYLSDLRRLITNKYILPSEPDKNGLPRVLYRIEVSTRFRFLRKDYVAELKSCIMDAVKIAAVEKGVNLLAQKVPAIYVQLEEVVKSLAYDRKLQNKDPVLHAEQYKMMVLHEMDVRHSHSFRDLSELNQATQFLHENGVLLHYDDVNLQDVYFLDPQWLCDILANVVTIREINRLARAGIMRADDLKMLFKNAAFKPDDIKAYVINLLNKFEVALLWDDTNLLIPSLLPTEEEAKRGLAHVQIPLKGAPRRYYSTEAPVIHSQVQLTSIQGGQNETLKSLPQSGPHQKPGSFHSARDTAGRSQAWQRLSTVDEQQDIVYCVQGVQNVDKRKGVQNTSDMDSMATQKDGCNAQGDGSLVSTEDNDMPLITCINNPASCLVRLYLMSYFPSGFWPRFITRLLGDPSFYATATGVYELPELLKANERFLESTDACPMWKCWQTGVRLDYLGACVLRVKEVGREDSNAFCDYRQCRIQIEQQDVGPVNVSSTSILEILLPNEALSVAFEKMPLATSMTDSMFMSLVIHPDQRVVASLLNKVVDHIDTLLEDWYPDLGARFVQNSKGMYLITRLVPCIRCLVIQSEIQNKRLESDHAWSLIDVSPKDLSPTVTKPVLITQNSNLSTSGEYQEGSGPNALCTSASTSAMDTVSDNRRSRVGDNRRKGIYLPEETNVSSIMTPGLDAGLNSFAQSVPTKFIREDRQKVAGKAATADPAFGRREESNWDGYLSYCRENRAISAHSTPCRPVCCYLVEQCMQAAQSNRVVYCPTHGHLGPYFIASQSGLITRGHIAPDSVFQDIGDDYLINNDLITRGRFLGRGAFGAVYAGTLLDKNTEEEVAIAMKMMQPVAPDNDAPRSMQMQYKQENERWNKDPMKHACEAYLNVRKELSILLSLQHEHIVSLLGVSTHPMCLVLSLAPQGSLSQRLEDYCRKGAKLSVSSIHDIVKQVSSALAYLHSNKIIYRDLKSENVLVWQLPSPDDLDEEEQDELSPVNDFTDDVHVKLADYGVSRSVLPWGTKGLAGTPPFMAPEIIQHNGEETYTEKVDCYSFGMFMYELMAQKTPFDSDVTTQGIGRFNRDSYIVSGGRPAITYQECIYPSAMLDLMSICWSHDPGSRPSASQIEELASRAEFTQLCGTIPLPEHEKVNAAVCVPSLPALLHNDLTFSEDEIREEEDEEDACDVWLSLAPDMGCDVRPALAVYTYNRHGCSNAKKRLLAAEQEITVMCATHEHVWCADSLAHIHIYSIGTLEKVMTFPVSSRDKPGQPTVKAMVYGAGTQKVYIFINSAQTSRFVVCTAVIPPPGDSPVTMECPGNGKLIHSVALLSNNDSEELWCGHAGQKAGELSVWSMRTQQTRSVTHDREKENRTVHLIVTDPAPPHPAAWTYVYPGTEVYRWDVYSRQVTHVVDLSHVVPKYPTAKLAQHINKNFFMASKCQVVCMCVQQDFLFVGTTLGCVTVLNKHMMTSLSIVQCNTEEQPIDILLPLVFSSPQMSDVDSLSNSSASESNKGDCNSTHLLSTCRGYTDVTSQVLPRYDVVRSQRAQHYMTLWRAQGWMTSAKQAFLQASDYVID